MASSEDVLLGKLAVREGVCSQAQIDECLTIQSNTRSPAPLGDLLLYKGYLTEDRLKDLLSRQHKKIMACPSCRLSFTVLTLSAGKSARCPRCKGPLDEAGAGIPTRTDAEFSTQRIKITPPAKRPSPSTAPGVSMTCVVCDQTFEWAPDPSGRVQCPSCQSTFNSRK